MSEKRQDELFRQLAERYLSADGERLRRELEELESQPVARAAPRLDRMVNSRIRGGGRRRTLQGLGLVAACLALFVLVPQLVTRQSGGSAPDMAAEEEAAALPAPAEEATDLPPEQSVQERESPEGLIPLAFDLPENFAVEDVDQDRGQSIYYLSDRWLDDVVMTLEYPGEPVGFEGLTPLEIGDTTVYGTSQADYQLLTFQKEDVLYVLTCKHDINTLASLSRSIL